MKTTYLLLTLTLITGFTSCTRVLDHDAKPYFRANLNGVATSFEIDLNVGRVPNGGKFYITIDAFNEKDLMRVFIMSDQDNFAAGQTYSSDLAGGVYYHNDLYADNPDNKWMSIYNYAAVPEMFSLKINKINSSYVEGTFSADLYRDIDNEIEKIEVRNGEFLVRFHGWGY
jgi:hypothetical protein